MHDKKGFKIVYEDEAIIVIDKPSGILVVPDFNNQASTLTNFLNKELVSKGREYRVYPCHRLDRETSGLVIFAKGKNNQQLVMEEFKSRRVKKRYIAFVHGKLNRESGTIESYVSSSFKQGDKNFRKPPKLAVTKYKLIRAGKDFSIVEVWPVTGRTNQIRIQFKQLGNPLLGERKYAFGKDFALKFRRPALHAANISFRHPLDNKTMEFSAVLPNDMQNFINLKLGAIRLN